MCVRWEELLKRGCQQNVGIVMEGREDCYRWTDKEMQIHIPTGESLKQVNRAITDTRGGC